MKRYQAFVITLFLMLPVPAWADGPPHCLAGVWPCVAAFAQPAEIPDPVWQTITTPVSPNLKIIDDSPVMVVCVTIHNVLKLCPNPPTIWMSPDVQPREVAERFLDALKSMGYLPVETLK